MIRARNVVMAAFYAVVSGLSCLLRPVADDLSGTPWGMPPSGALLSDGGRRCDGAGRSVGGGPAGPGVAVRWTTSQTRPLQPPTGHGTPRRVLLHAAWSAGDLGRYPGGPAPPTGAPAEQDKAPPASVGGSAGGASRVHLYPSGPSANSEERHVIRRVPSQSSRAVGERYDDRRKAIPTARYGR
ncbi:hypothetical protein GCM10011594_36060 [Nakamurella endophytica]|uniref:Uncharacterized protein n=1 Tax=Nakamurella endophytica TaxID=1748367 RepID=A0A917WLG8_9ACTN|nr:hypothetical protein GCM10011594_36060 [Nakamurella endophytica]